MSFPIAIVSDCYGQAMSRMLARVAALCPDARCIPYESSSLVEAGGNIVDAVDALAGTRGAVLCNSAPRRDTRDTNGSTIVYGMVGETIIISTVGALGMVKKVVPHFTARAVDVNTFMERFAPTNRHTFNFRGLEVIPHIIHALLAGGDLSEVSEPCSGFPAVEPCVWLVDTIEGKPTNLKLSILRDEADGWFVPDDWVSICFGDMSARKIQCFERLTHVPDGQPGIYEGSSGLGDRRFLEVAVMGGGASAFFNVPMSGIPISIYPTTAPRNDL